MSNRGRGRSKLKDVGSEAHGAPVTETPFPGLPLPPQKWWHRARDPPSSCTWVQHLHRGGRGRSPTSLERGWGIKGGGALRNHLLTGSSNSALWASHPFYRWRPLLCLPGALLSTPASLSNLACMPVPSPSHLVYPTHLDHITVLGVKTSGPYCMWGWPTCYNKKTRF